MPNETREAEAFAEVATPVTGTIERAKAAVHRSAIRTCASHLAMALPEVADTRVGAIERARDGLHTARSSPPRQASALARQTVAIAAAPTKCPALGECVARGTKPARITITLAFGRIAKTVMRAVAWAELATTAVQRREGVVALAMAGAASLVRHTFAVELARAVVEAHRRVTTRTSPARVASAFSCHDVDRGTFVTRHHGERRLHTLRVRAALAPEVAAAGMFSATRPFVPVVALALGPRVLLLYFTLAFSKDLVGAILRAHNSRASGPGPPLVAAARRRNALIVVANTQTSRRMAVTDKCFLGH